MSQRYEVPVTWICEECHQGGDLSVPPSSYNSVSEKDLADRAHAAADPECAAQWGGRFVYVSQSIIPD